MSHQNISTNCDHTQAQGTGDRSPADQPGLNRWAKGTAEWIGRGGRGYWFAKVSVPGQADRQRLKLSDPEGRYLTDKEGDRELAVQLAEQVSEALRSEEYRKEEARRGARFTVEQFGNQWTSGELYEKHGNVNGLRPLVTAKENAYRLKAFVYPLIGAKAVADVTEHDIERVMVEAARLAKKKRGRDWRQSNRLQLYQVMRRLFDLAIRPGRLREDSPVSKYLRPGKDKPKLYSFLYPLEFLALLGCVKIPLARRVFYALAVYTGLRKSSDYALGWCYVDFTNGTLTSLVSKNGVPQLFELSPDLLAVLKAWYKECGEPAGDVHIINDIGCELGREAKALRRDLKSAGVDRQQLFATEGNVERIRFHDLRATFVTWARRAGKGWGWISDRTGHLTPEMMRRYDRGARTLQDLQYRPFPDISDAIPEFSNKPSRTAQIIPFRRRHVGRT